MQNFIQQIQQQLDKKLPFVAYRKPNEGTITAILQKDDTLHVVNNFAETGFIFAPFDTHSKSVLIPLDKKFTTVYAHLETKKATIVKETFEVKKHLDLVTNAIQVLQTNTCKKIVLSRVIKLEIDAINSIDTFQQLLALYTSAFVYIWYHPKVGCWLGATPEVLLQTRSNTFKTMALAGTQKYKQNIHWEDKEVEEQNIVTSFIYSELSDTTESVALSSPYTIKAGNLAHIRTDITGLFEQAQLGNIIKALHPTPAVCGMPKEMAKAFILKNEGYNRTFYTGFLGELNHTTSRKNNRRNTENHAYNFEVKTTNLFVNLRCMQIENNTVSIYVGGGITAASDAALEYQETEHKANTMRAVFLDNPQLNSKE